MPGGFKSPFLSVLGAGFLLMAPAFFSAKAESQGADSQSEKPDIVFIMGDDIGMWNIGAYDRAMIEESMTAPRTARLRRLVLPAAIAAAGTGCPSLTPESDPLPSWRDGAAKQGIFAFVAGVTETGGANYVPPAERIAVFDNDGTLWAEQPMYFQLAFALDRLKELAPSHPEWKAKEPMRSALAGDLKQVMAGGVPALLELVMATHAGVTTDEFRRAVEAWQAKAKHPKTGRLYTAMVYQPMLELLAYLRENRFKTYIVSGGGVAFMRPFAERVYGIPPEQVIGSSIETALERRGGVPVLVRRPKLSFLDDKAGKPIAINLHIGRRPIAAFGNSDGDLEMLQWTAAGAGPRFCLCVHHTDAEREWAYDRKSHVGRLDKGLDEAKARGWTVVDMKRDWNRIFPFDEKEP